MWKVEEEVENSSGSCSASVACTVYTVDPCSVASASTLTLAVPRAPRRQADGQAGRRAGRQVGRQAGRQTGR